MFLFNRKPVENSCSDEKHKNNIVSKESAQSKQMNDFHKIAVYFNQRYKDISGYQMSLRQKRGNDSYELESPSFITEAMILQIRNNQGMYLEGHVRTVDGLIKDVYDSEYPFIIFRERQGEFDTLSVNTLVVNEPKRLISNIMHSDILMNMHICNSLKKEDDKSF